MRRPLFPIVLALALTILLSSSAGSRAQRAFLSKYIWRSKLQRPYMQIFREAPFEAPPTFEAPTRFQRGVDPGDEGREVDMRMIFDELKRDMREAMEEKRETRTVWPEAEEEDGSDFNIKQPSSYSLYKYRL